MRQMVLHLVGDCGDTGSSFRNWDEVWDWYAQYMGHKPNHGTMSAIEAGKPFMVGARFFTVERRWAVEHVNVA